MSQSFELCSGVYALVDPRTGRTMYVGMSTDIERRYRSHLTGITRDRNRPKADWIEELQRYGIQPQLVVLAECPPGDLGIEERRFIRLYRERGEAEFNRSDGGLGGTMVRGNMTGRDEWFLLGVKLRRLSDLLGEIIEDLIEIAPKRLLATFVVVQRALNNARSHLEGYLRQKYPDWETLTRDIFSVK